MTTKKETNEFAGRIVKLEATNFKRLRAVEITPDGNMVVVGGRNKQGKTSLLDSIAVVLGGKGESPDVPVREGEDKATIVADLGNIIVRRVYTKEGGTNLQIKNKEGAVYPSPQKMLDELVGKIGFDPFSFMRLSEKDQAQSLREIVGIDPTELDSRRKTIYEDRTRVNREAKEASARLDVMPFHKDIAEGALPKSFREVKEKLGAAKEHNRAKLRLIDAARSEETNLMAAKGEVLRFSNTIAELEEKLAGLRTALTGAEKREKYAEGNHGVALAAVNGFVGQDEDSILTEMEEITAYNNHLAQNDSWFGQRDAGKKLADESNTLTAQLGDIDEEKEKLLAKAKFPIEGLGFGEFGVTFNGLPLDQASGAEQLQVAVAMSASLNPKLRVVLLRDASLLDKESFAQLCALAKQYDIQVWAEVVRADDGVTVVIEDGTIREDATA